jgi:hypothetical protein
MVVFRETGQSLKKQMYSENICRHLALEIQFGFQEVL